MAKKTDTRPDDEVMTETAISLVLRPVVTVFDPKGGVGKSTTCRGLLYCYASASIPVLLIDTDGENPDIFKEHARWVENGGWTSRNPDAVEAMQCIAQDETGFIGLGNLIASRSDRAVLVNTPAGAGGPFLPYWADIADAVGESGRRFKIVFPIDRGKDTLEILRDFLDAMEPQKRSYLDIIVLKNTFFGQDNQFVRFDEWFAYQKSKKPDRSSIVVGSWPELNDLVVDKLAIDRSTLDEAASLTTMEKSALHRYQRHVLAVTSSLGLVVRT